MAICLPQVSKNIWDFDPRSIPGCQLWFDAADSSTITLNGSTVSSWRDKSSNGYTVAQSTSGNQPTYATNLLNGLPGIQLSSQKFLEQVGSNMPNFTSSTSTTVLIVAKNGSTLSATGWNIVNTTWFNSSGTGLGRYHFSFAQSTTNGVTLYASDTLVGTPTVVPLGSNAIIGFTASPSGNLITVNGTVTSYSGSTLPSTNNSTFFRFGDDRASFVTDVNIYEFIGFNDTITTTQRQQIEGYLAWKWGIKTSLPATHPLYSIKPYLRSFQPSDFSGLSVWFDAADTSTITGTSTVTAWRDKSTNSWNATTLIGTAPTNTTVNGLNAVSFPASSVLTVSNVSFSSVQSRAVFVVYRVPTSAPNFISWFSTQGGGLNNQGGHNNLVYPSGGGGPYIQSYAVGGAVQGMGADPAVSTIGTTAIACMIHSAFSTSRNTVTLNGTSYALSNNTLASGYGSGTVTYYIGNGYPQAYILCEYILYQREFTQTERQQVEGYLAHKWGTTSTIPSTHAFKTFPSSSALPFLPTNFSRCVLWLDPTDTSTVTLNGSNVSQLNDKSGLGYNMTQATSGNQPTYSTALNGNRMLTFTQASSTRLSNSSFPAFIGSGAASYFLVEYNMSAPSGNPSPFGYSAGPNFGIIMQYNAGFTGGLQPFSTGVSSFTSATPRLIFLYKENVGSTNMIGFINGTSQTVSDTTSGTYSGTFNVGSGPNGFISGNICELIVFNRSLTTTERQQIEGYLAHKWGLQYSLPSTHLYTKFQPAQRSFLLPGTIATVTLSALSGSGGTITWTTSTNAENYKWYVGTTFPTALVSGTVGNVLTTAVSFAFVASTNYFAWVIPVSSTETDGATTTSSSASYTSGGDITSANLNTIATYLRSYMSEFRNPSFYGYSLDGTSYYIGDGGLDMYDTGNWTYPWLISGAQFTAASGSQQAFSINYSATTATTIDTDFIYASLGYTQGTGVSSIHPLTVLGFRSTVGRPVGFQLAGNSGADGGGTLASGILYAGTTLSGFTVHAFYRETYNAGDPSHCNLFILLGHTNWSSVFGTISSFADPVSNGGNGCYFYTSGAGVKNILAVQTLLSKSGGALVSAAECQTVVQAFANRIKLSLGF